MRVGEGHGVPVLRVLGRSGSGKTTFIDRLIPLLAPLQVAVIKHTRHELTPPPPVKDTGLHLAAGAVASIGLSPNGSECFWRGAPPDIEHVLSWLAGKVDLVLVEGARDLDLPTILLGEEPPDACVSQVLLRLPARPEALEEACRILRESAAGASLGEDPAATGR